MRSLKSLPKYKEVEQKKRRQKSKHQKNGKKKAKKEVWMIC
jgi:hypothetical protein